MPKQSSSFQTVFSRKIRINTREMKAGRLRGGAGRHPRVVSRAQMLAISASQAHKIVNQKHRRRRRR